MERKLGDYLESYQGTAGRYALGSTSHFHGSLSAWISCRWGYKVAGRFDRFHESQGPVRCLILHAVFMDPSWFPAWVESGEPCCWFQPKAWNLIPQNITWPSSSCIIIAEPPTLSKWLATRKDLGVGVGRWRGALGRSPSGISPCKRFSVSPEAVHHPDTTFGAVGVHVQQALTVIHPPLPSTPVKGCCCRKQKGP